jgi:hypothetical protein
MHRNRLAAILLTVLMAGPAAGQPPQGSPASAVSVPRGAGVNVMTLIQGNAFTSTNAPLADTLVRLRNARTGRIVASTRTDRAGLFAFRPSDPGSYIVELVGPADPGNPGNNDQRVLAASEILNVDAGDAASVIVRLPFRLQPYAGVLGHTVASALLVTATAAAAGVLASQVAGEPVSPRR